MKLYAVIDTNVIVSALLTKNSQSPTRVILDSVFTDKVTPLLNPEILAEYKRKGISKYNLIKGMLSFGVPFLIKELLARKKRAKADGIKCIKAAESIGLVMSGGTVEFPSFDKK